MGNYSFEEEPSIPLEQELSDQDGRGKCCSESLFHCCCCPGSFLAQAKIGRDLFLLPAACNSPLIFSNWFCRSTEDMLWCFTLPYPFSEIGKAERCFPMPGNCSPWIQSRCDFVLSLYVEFVALYPVLLEGVLALPIVPVLFRRIHLRTCRMASGRSVGFVLSKAPLFPLDWWWYLSGLFCSEKTFRELETVRSSGISLIV